MDFDSYSIFFKASYLTTLIPTILVILSAMLSAREMGGTLGQGIKKIAAGTIVDTIVVSTYVLLERGDRGILNDDQVRTFFFLSGLFASVLLVSGYIQVYKIAKKLKLFTI
jgi:hypothetical protein